MKYSSMILSVLLCVLFASSIHAQDVILENKHMRLVIGDDALVKSLVHKPTGQECIDKNIKEPFCAITQYRPYDNENFLMFPAKPRTFPACKAQMCGDSLKFEFSDTYDIAYIKVNVADSYISFDFVKRDYRIEDFGVKRKTELDEFTFANIPILQRERFGEWLNVMWDDSVAVALIATAPQTFIDSQKNYSGTTLAAATHDNVKLYNSGAALITAAPSEFLDCVDMVEHDFDMPLGVESRRNKAYPYSYYELRNVTVDNIDENIALAKQGGFKAMVVYYVDFAKACGHYEWRDEYPNGIADLKTIVDKIKKAGMIPGLHMHYSKVAVTDPYINSGVPDSRMNVVRNFTLAKDLTPEDTDIFVEENPEGVRMESGRKLLHIGTELIMYDSISVERPYAFTGCRRGVYNSSKSQFSKGVGMRLLDVDDWPLFIRVNQDTDIQEEIATNIGGIYSDAGFEFVYFDGAEDVPMPYWYNVSRSQLKVYNHLTPKPLFAEGALKSHYGWHILTRGNAFDIFPPERIRPAMKKYTLRCARQVYNDFTSVNFGWVNYLAPSDKTIGMQPDMYEYICSKALAWDCPISLVANLDEMKKHPRNDDNLAAIKLWEDAKLSHALNAEQKELIKNADKEFTIFKNAKGNVRLVEIEQIVSDEENKTIPVRAFAFAEDGKTYIIYWNVSGASEIKLNIKPSLYNMAWKRLKIKKSPVDNSYIIPADIRRILELDLPLQQAVKIFKQSL